MTIGTREPSGALPIGNYAVGQVVGAVSARYTKSRTTPPDYYDMATILDAMLSAERFAKTEQQRQVLRQVEGLGTSRTRQGIVDEMVRKGLFRVERKGRRHVVRPTDFGMQMRDFVPPQLSDVALTANWEVAFGMVEAGKVTWRDVLDKTYGLVDQVLAVAKSQASSAPNRSSSGVSLGLAGRGQG